MHPFNILRREFHELYGFCLMALHRWHDHQRLIRILRLENEPPRVVAIHATPIKVCDVSDGVDFLERFGAITRSVRGDNEESFHNFLLLLYKVGY